MAVDKKTRGDDLRFVVLDGLARPAILTGPALSDKEKARRFETLLSRLVVVRGSEAMAPQELIPLVLPGKRPGLIPQKAALIDPLERGPEITEIG